MQNCVSIVGVRKFLAILLLVFFGMPAVAQIFARAAQDSSGLPACCRRDGKHHCMTNMTNMAQRNVASDPSAQLSAVQDKCPYCPASVAVAHRDLHAPPAADAIFAELARHPAVAAQTESKARMARDRSRQKRGPPSFLG